MVLFPERKEMKLLHKQVFWETLKLRSTGQLYLGANEGCILDDRGQIGMMRFFKTESFQTFFCGTSRFQLDKEPSLSCLGRQHAKKKSCMKTRREQNAFRDLQFLSSSLYSSCSQSFRNKSSSSPPPVSINLFLAVLHLAPLANFASLQLL